MIETRRERRRLLILLAALAVPAAALAGIQPQGIQPQGIQPQGIQPQGIQPQGIQPQGIQPQGIQPQGIQPQGIQPQGIQPQGIQPQGIQPQGVALMGTDVVSVDLKGTAIHHVAIRGTTADSTVVSHELTAGPGISTGTGGYIAVGPTGDSAKGHYAIAHLADNAGNPTGEQIDLYIAEESKDPVPNLLHRVEDQDNDDVTLYTAFVFHRWSGQWASMCPFDEQTGGTTAMAIPENPASDPKKFVFACTATGVAAKCARRWGFRPWRQGTTFKFSDAVNDWVPETFELKPFYDACKIAAQAAYCQDARSFTRNGTLVDLFDTRQFIWPNAIENPFNMSVDDSRWMMAQEYFVNLPGPGDSPGALLASALQRSRWRDLDPFASCGGAAVASIDRLERDHFEDGRWANPLTAPPRLQVFSPNACTHHEDQIGAGLPWDCTPCTTAVCKTLPQCCTLNPAVTAWDAACVAEASVVCSDGAGGTQTGLVWPDDVPPAHTFGKYLLGPAGAVFRTDDVSTALTSASVSGWACDPEFPGAAVTVEVFSGPRELPGSVSLGTARAELPLSASLAPEVAAACQGPNKTTARLGFSLALPPGTAGNVFVYALDTKTADGPAAPPTLLRNGIVRVATCAHSEHEAGGPLASGCSACVEEICAANAACCSTSWDAACVAAADSCGDGDTSAAVSSRAFSAVTTGWIEAPATGSYVFESAGLPSRLFVNGSPVLDWFGGPGTTSGSIQLQRGGKYHLRWDRYQAAPLAVPGTGLTWQQPGTVGQAAIPAAFLYRITPGSGTGLAATYVGPGPMNTQRLDATVDLSASKPPFPPPTPSTGYTAFWSGEVMPLFSENYTFHVQSAGPTALSLGGATIISVLTAASPPAPAPAPHSPCVLGEKLLDDGSDTCVSQVCAEDEYCCNGGYLSYYSIEPVWDGKCVAEARAMCPGVCTGPPPSVATRELSGAPALPLQAGVRYRLLLAVQNLTSDPNVSLSWESPRQHKEVIPTYALYPALPAAAAAGGGLNVVLFKAGLAADGTPALTTLLASGSVTDLSLAPALGLTGLPLVEVVPPAPTPAQLRPASPVLEMPRFEGHATVKGGTIEVKGIGGILGGSVVVSDGALTTVLPIDPLANFGGAVTVAGPGKRDLKLYQSLRPDGSCPLATDCSPSLGWTVTLDPTTPGAVPPPRITAPRDLTHSPDPSNDVFEVTGTGINAPVHVCDEGTAGASVISTNLSTTADGVITGKITLSPGTATVPLAGWHKLRFTQAASCAAATASEKSAPVFVSVGIRPPTVEFPRSGAEIDCSPTPGPIKASGSVPYSSAQLGPIFVAEETGRANVNVVVRDVPVVQRPDGSFGFDIPGIQLAPGKHLLYFFQLPGSGAGDFRAFSSLANTPRSRIEVRIPPRRLLAPDLDLSRLSGTFIQFSNSKSCSTGGLACALGRADVNVRLGGRLWTFRANQQGEYGGVINQPPGWYDMQFAQVVDSPAGGGWQESCPSDPFRVGIHSDGPRPTLELPGTITVPATSPAGAKVEYQATATGVDGKPVIPSCAPPSGATFPVGTTEVLCTATDPQTKGVEVGSFLVRVVDGPPVVNVPPGGITAEAQNPLGAMVSYDVTASDVVDGSLPVSCFPAAPPGAPALFLLDVDTTVSCSATDRLGQTTTATFVVRVRDTTPPALCELPDITVPATTPTGAPVAFATCAKDLVDVSVPVTCKPPSGSFFPLGSTKVTCSATDKHGNASPPATFTVTVSDTTPPKLILPGPIDVVATSLKGAIVKYSVSATDNQDPKPVVSCTPPSGSQFPLGTTVVKCTASDASGNQSHGSFPVRVRIGWSDLLPPIPLDGSGHFKRPKPLRVSFALVGESAAIQDLPARLFVAPLDKAGNPGPEIPAPGLPPTSDNLFRFNHGQYEYWLLLDTRALGPGPWQLRTDLGDGVLHTVRITLDP